MAIIYNWQYHQETGLDGGTGNPSHNLFYIDPQNGNDGNTGAYNAPLKTLQQAHDLDQTSDKVVCGSFTGIGIAGDFSGSSFIGGIIAEGLVTFDNSAGTDFNTSSSGTTCFFNASFSSSSNVVTARNFGVLHFKNYSGAINFSSSSVASYAGDSIFENCLSLCPISNHAYPVLKRNLFINSTFGTANLRMGAFVAQMDNNTFINCSIFSTGWAGGLNYSIRNNYFDTNTTMDIGSTLGNAPKTMDFNFWQGSITNKIRYGTVWYTDIEALRLANPTVAVNDLPSATVPALNSHNAFDFTPSQASPLIKKGFDKSTIGFAEPANVIDVASATYFTHGANFTVGSGEVTLAVAGAHTFTTEPLYHHEIAPKKRVILKLNAPDLEQNFGLGEVMGSELAANFTTVGLDDLYTPYKTDIEIQYTTDTNLVNGVAGSDDNYNGTWLKMAIGEQPMHDTVNDVGNDDPLFDVDNAVPIATKYIKIRVTLRDDEVGI